MTIAIIRRDGKVIGVTEYEPHIGPLVWFHRHCPAYSMDHAVEHEGWTVTEVDEIDCHEVAEILESIARRAGVSFEFKFVPYSQSRNAGKWESLNWKITVSNSRESFTTDYSQGIAAVGINYRIRTIDVDDAIKEAIETGRYSFRSLVVKKIQTPRIGDVLNALVRDAEALEYSCFEDWADNLGYGSDSIKAKRVYDECLATAFRLRSILGKATLEEMQLVAQFN